MCSPERRAVLNDGGVERFKVFRAIFSGVQRPNCNHVKEYSSFCVYCSLFVKELFSKISLLTNTD